MTPSGMPSEDRGEQRAPSPGWTPPVRTWPWVNPRTRHTASSRRLRRTETTSAWAKVIAARTAATSARRTGRSATRSALRRLFGTGNGSTRLGNSSRTSARVRSRSAPVRDGDPEDRGLEGARLDAVHPRRRDHRTVADVRFRPVGDHGHADDLEGAGAGASPCGCSLHAVTDLGTGPLDREGAERDLVVGRGRPALDDHRFRDRHALDREERLRPDHRIAS